MINISILGVVEIFLKAAISSSWTLFLAAQINLELILTFGLNEQLWNELGPGFSFEAHFCNFAGIAASQNSPSKGCRHFPTRVASPQVWSSTAVGRFLKQVFKHTDFLIGQVGPTNFENFEQK